MLLSRLAEMLKILTINSFMSVEDARGLLSQLVKDHDQNGDGKFSYAGRLTQGQCSTRLPLKGYSSQ